MSFRLLGSVLSQQSAWASVPTKAMTSSIDAATLVAAGRAAAGAISPTVAALNTGVMKAMSMTKIKRMLAVALIAALAGGAGLIYAAARGDKNPHAGRPIAGDDVPVQPVTIVPANTNGRYQIAVKSGTNNTAVFVIDSTTGQCWFRDTNPAVQQWTEMGSPAIKVNK